MADNSVYRTILGEATYGPNRYQDMLAVASAIANRARATGVSPAQIVSAPSQFDAYSKPLPKGSSPYLGMAQKAWNEVQTKGPVHTGSYFATPSAVKNLPSGLREVHTTSGHRYFEDPQNRAVATSLGYRAPNRLTGAQQAIQAQTTQRAQAAAPRNVPTPTFAQRTAPTLSASLASNPVNPASVRTASSVPAGLTSMAQIGSRVGPSTAYGIPTPTSRPNAPTQVATRAPDPSRFGNIQTETMPAAMQDRFAELAGVKGSRVAPQSVTAGLAPSPQQEANLRDRLGTFTPTVDVADLRRSVPTPTANPLSVGNLLGVSSARAATPPTPTARPATTPTVSGVAGVTGSLRSRASQLPAGALDTPPAPTIPGRVPTPVSAPRTAVAAPSVAGRVPTPTARPGTVPTPTSRPSVAAPARTAPTVQRTAAAPARQAQAVDRDPWGGLRTPVAASQVAAPARSGPFGLSPGRIAGAALGGAIAGPVGGLLGGLLGGRIGSNGTTAQGRGGPAGSNGGRASSGRSSGGSAFAGGSGGFTERDSAVGLDGGKVGGGSRSSGRSGSSSSGRSGSSGGKSGGSSGKSSKK